MKIATRIDRSKHIFYYFSMILLTVFCGYILLCAFGNLDHADFLLSFLKGYQIPLILLGGVIFFYVLSALFSGFVSRLSDKQQKRAVLVLFFFLVVLQITVIFVLNASLRYDTLSGFDEAAAMFKNGRISMTASGGYFAKYPNNIPITIFTFWLFKIADLAGMAKSDFMVYINFVNLILIDLAVYFSYGILKKTKSRKLGIKFLLICVMNPLLYAYVPFFYTPTFSMPFIMGSLYLFICIMEEKHELKKQVEIFLLGVLLVIGFQVRATVIITGIAIFIYLLVKNRRIYKHQDRGLRIRKNIIMAALCLSGACLSWGAYKGIESTYTDWDTKESGFPVTHWIMMGLQGNGTYSGEDDQFTQNFSTKNDRTKANLEVISSRIREMGVTGLVKLAGRKLAVTWSDGIDDCIDNLSLSQNYTKVHDYISGRRNDFFVVYCHVYQVFLLCFLFAGVISKLRKKCDTALYLIYLNLLGGMLFHLLWEAGEVYSVCFSFLVMVLAAEGLETSIKFAEFKNVTVYTKAAGILCALFTLAALVLCYPGFTRNPYSQYEYAAKQDLAQNPAEEALLPGTELIQTFRTSRPFNTLSVKVRNDKGEKNLSSYTVLLENDRSQVVMTAEVQGARAFDKDFYTMQFDTVIPGEMKEFKIHIQAKNASDLHNLVFQSYETGNWDAYRNGGLKRNGIDANGDLTFAVYHQMEKPYMGKAAYITLSVLLMGAELTVFALYSVRHKKKWNHLPAK